MEENGVHFSETERTHQSMEWKPSVSPRFRKCRVQKIAGKLLASVFWNCQGVIMIDFLDTGTTKTDHKR